MIPTTPVYLPSPIEIRAPVFTLAHAESKHDVPAGRSRKTSPAPVTRLNFPQLWEAGGQLEILEMAMRLARVGSTNRCMGARTITIHIHLLFFFFSSTLT